MLKRLIAAWDKIKTENDISAIQGTIDKLARLRNSIDPETAVPVELLLRVINFVDGCKHGYDEAPYSHALARRIFDVAVPPEKRVALYIREARPITDLLPFGPMHRQFRSFYGVMIFVGKRDVINAASDVCRQLRPVQAEELYDTLERVSKADLLEKPKRSLFKTYFPDEPYAQSVPVSFISAPPSIKLLPK